MSMKYNKLNEAETTPSKETYGRMEREHVQVVGYYMPAARGQLPRQHPPATPVYHNEDPACNMYWALFFLGLLLFPGFLICGSCGVRSSLHNEQIAGKANLIALCIILGILFIYSLVYAISGDEEEKQV